MKEIVIKEVFNKDGERIDKLLKCAFKEYIEKELEKNNKKTDNFQKMRYNIY